MMFFSRTICANQHRVPHQACVISEIFIDKGFLIKAFKRIQSFDDVKVFGIRQKNSSSPTFKIRAGNGYQVFEM